ncbi:MAG: VWA domain-containing protein, partial [Kiritimatiellae bacterium]|nr:VWA domain-containing protein [Kiritimatiellia bacterium]
MSFTHPFTLFFLLLLPFILVFLQWRWKKFAEQLTKLSRHAQVASTRIQWQSWLLLAGIAMLILSLAGPGWGRGGEETIVRTRNVMLAVDVSRSMLATDVRPNRLERAKADLIDLVDALKGDRAGLLAFRGKSVILCPMTTDIAFLRQSIDGLAPDSAPSGETDLADAIETCLLAFEQAKSSHNAINLISAGEDLAGRAKRLADLAGERKVPIFTVGIGSTQGGTIPEGGGVLTYEGKQVTTQLTEATLKMIATASGGHYVPLATAGTAQTTLGAVYARYLSRLADEEMRERHETMLVDRTWLFATLGIMLTLSAGMLSLGRLGRFIGTFTLLGVCLTGELCAQELARNAQRLYQKGAYAESAELYAEARLGAESSEIAHFAYNEALALWQSGNLTNALERIQLAVDAKPFTARAATLEGHLSMALAEQTVDIAERLALREAAVAAFSKALRAEPNDVAQRNLARALSGLDTLRKEARKAAALKRFEKIPFQQLVPQILHHQRSLMKAVPEVFNSTKPALVLSQAEQLAKDVSEQSDRWFPILETLPQIVTNETVCLELMQHAQTAQATLDDAAKQYETLNSDQHLLNKVEPIAYNFWKWVAQPDALIQEAIAVQTNALTSLERYQPARDDEEEVLNLVQQFRMIFPQWAEEYLKQQAASTNAVTFTEADRDLIARTADATV